MVLEIPVPSQPPSPRSVSLGSSTSFSCTSKYGMTTSCAILSLHCTLKTYKIQKVIAFRLHPSFVTEREIELDNYACQPLIVPLSKTALCKAFKSVCKITCDSLYIDSHWKFCSSDTLIQAIHPYIGHTSTAFYIVFRHSDLPPLVEL